MLNNAKGDKQSPRLNPFAFPADTDFRFVLLIALVVGSSLYIFWQMNRIGSQIIFAAQCKLGVGFIDCIAPYTRVVGWWLICGVVLVFAVAGGIYWLFPMWKLWRNKFVPLTAEDAPKMVIYLADLCHEVGLVKAPVFVLNHRSSGTDGLAFGHMGQYYVVLSGGLVTLFSKDQAAFRAILLHELAHLVNADINKTYFTIAVWWSFVAVALVPFTVISIDGLIKYPSGYLLVANEVWRILALSLFVYLTRNAVLRAREIYADVRASTWDGQSGALTRVLASLPHSRGRWRAIISVHPNPEERSQTLSETSLLFRTGFWEAFGTGIAIGIALPIMQFIMQLLASMFAFHNGAEFAMLGPALIFAPLAVGVVGLGVWRTTFAIRAGVEISNSAGRAGLCLGLGILLGTFLSFSNYFEPNSMNFAIVFVYGLPWDVLLLVVLFFFFRWIAAGASIWLAVATTNRSLRLIYTVGLVIASAVLVALFAQIFGFSLESEFIREGGLAGFDSSLVLLALPAQFLNALLQPEILLALISLWAFPLVAWFWRGRASMAAEANWAFLDSSSQPSMWLRLEPLFPRIALTRGLQIGFVYCVLLLIVRVGIRVGVSEVIRQSDQFITMLYYGQIALALLLQVVLAAIVAGKVRPLRSLHGLFAVFVGGCVMTLGLFDIDLLLGSTIEPVSAWEIFCFVVNGGMLLALPIMAIVSLALRGAHQTQQNEDPTSSTPSPLSSNVVLPSSPVYQPIPLAQPPFTNYAASPYDAPPPIAYIPPLQYISISPVLPVLPLPATAILPQKRSNRFLWIALIIIASLLVILCAYSIFFYVIPPVGTDVITSTPTITLNTYCTALKKEDYQTAYKQLSSGIQSHLTEAEFVSTYSPFAANGGLADCTANNIRIEDQLASGSITFTLGNGAKAIYDCTLTDFGDGWKITSLTFHH